MLKILLIDDEPIEERITHQLLKRDYGLPFTLEYAQSIDAGMALLRDRTYDVILLDDRIAPNVTAVQTVPIIRDAAGVVPLILISSSLDASHLRDKNILEVYDIIDKYDLKSRIRDGLLNKAA